MAIFVSDTEVSPPNTKLCLSRTPDEPAGIAGGEAGNRGGSSGQPQADAFDVESPRPVNTGAQITVPIVNQCLIDWLAFTIKEQDPSQVLEILKLDSGLFTELDRGGSGYAKSMRSGGIAIYYQGREDMGCHCIMRGQGCRQYEAHFPELPWLDLLNRALSCRATFTRLDLAHDNVDSTLDLKKLKQAITDKAIRTRFKSASNLNNYDLAGEPGQIEGNTIYFGKRASRVYLRFYDKAAQLELPFIWKRAEFELKEKRAHEAAKLLASGLPAGQLFVGILNNYLAVINHDNSNTSRCTLQDWWAAWLHSTEKIKLTTTPHIKTVPEVMDFVKRQYGPTLATIKTHLGPYTFSEFIRSVVKDGEARMNMRHEMILYVSSLGSSDNYDDDRITQDERAAIMEHDGELTKLEAEQAAQEIMQEEGEES